MIMALQSFGVCPWCSARMGMQKQRGVLTCPVCFCTFKHNWLTWFVGLPSAVVVSILVFKVIPVGLVAAFVGVALVSLVVNRMGTYVIITEGKKGVSVEEAESHVPEKKESRWVIAFFVLLMLAVVAFFIFSMKTL
jgi:hypothetical protein